MIEYINPELVLNNLANLPQLVFEVTDACNLKCKYCAYGEFYDDKDERHDSKLPIESAKRIIDYLVPLWNSDRNTSSKVPLFISFYGGEPLLNMDFVMSIVEYIKNEKVIYHRDIRFSMTTNAVLLHKYMDYLADNNFNLLISLDGNEKNHSYRVDHSGISSFSRVKHNVDILREKYPDYFDKNVNFNSVLHDRSSVQEVYDFIKQNYGKVPNINEINSSGIREDKKEEFYRTYKNAKQSLHQSENYEDIVKGMLYKSSDYSGLMKYLEGYSGNYYNTYLDLLLDEKKIKYIPTATCTPFLKKMFITVNGKILPCERIGQQYSLGHVSENNVDLDVEKISTIYNVYFSKMENKCNLCKRRKSCVQCMFYLNIEDENPKCVGFFSDKDFHIYKTEQESFLRKHPEAYTKLMKEMIIN